MLARVAFPAIRTFDSSRTPRRGERVATPRTLAEVDLSAITAALAAARTAGGDITMQAAEGGGAQLAELRRQLAERNLLLTQAQAQIVELKAEAAAMRVRLGQIANLAGEAANASPASEAVAVRQAALLPPDPGIRDPGRVKPARTAASQPAKGGLDGDNALHPAARKLLAALAQHAPARFTWGQVATLAGLKPSGGHYNAGRKQLRDLGMIAEVADLVAVSATGSNAAGVVPSAPSTPNERLALWCARLPSPAPEMLRGLVAQGDSYMDASQLAAALGKKPTGGHWNSGLALLRNNGLVEVRGKQLRAGELFR